MRGLLREVSIGVGAAICVLAYVFPYVYLPGVWWRAIPSTCLILLIGALFYGREAVEVFGLKMSARQVVLSSLLFLVLLPLFSYVLRSWVVVEPLSLHRSSDLRGWIHQFFQVFNDEIVLRGALLTVLIRMFPHPRSVILLTALCFSLGHHVLYRFNDVQIDWTAMVSLFSFGAIVNCLFVRYRHIGYGLALHYAWNLDRFGGRYYLDGAQLSEGATFNYIEGNLWVISVAFMMFLAVFGGYSLSRSSILGAVKPGR